MQLIRHGEGQNSQSGSGNTPVYGSSGIQRLMKAYIGRKDFTGAYDEDRKSALETFSTMFNLFHLGLSEKPEAMPLMLHDESQTFFSKGATSKSRFLARNFRDKVTTSIATKSPTVSRLWQRIALTKAALMPEFTSYLPDNTQAYFQSDFGLKRDLYMRAPAEMGLDNDEILPVYGIPESRLHWFVTYHCHRIETNNMNATRGAPCLLYRLNAEKKKTEGMTVLQVDDSYGHGTEEVLKDEDQGSHKFKSKPRQLVREEDTVIFNGANNDNLKSQLGFVLILVDGSGHGCIIQYECIRCKRVTRSVMAAEVHGLIYGFDEDYLARNMLEEVLRQKREIDGYIDSRTVFNVVAKNNSSLAKRRQIDLHALTEVTHVVNFATLPGSEAIKTGCRGKGEDLSILLLLPQATHSIYITRTSNVKPAKTGERKNAD